MLYPPAAMADHERLTEAAKILKKADAQVNILRALEWPARIKKRFFARGAKEPPKVSYPKRDLSAVHEAVARAVALVPGSSEVDEYVRRQAQCIDVSARLIESAGSPDFFEHSVELYGLPTSPLVDGKSTSLQLAMRIDKILNELAPSTLGPSPKRLNAHQIAERIQHSVDSLLGDQAPRVIVAENMAAKAAARTDRIRLRANAEFTTEDVNQLVMHEAMVHIATSLNGKRQKKVPLLAARHAGTTRTQEGLAVFSELISGSLGPNRLQRLSDRVLAIQMSIDGADFLDLYRFFLERSDTGDEQGAFEDARRIVRGGLIGGGAPFTKDGVYLDGLLRVHNFLRSIVELRRPDLMPLLFCGKLDIEDLPALAVLRGQKLVRAPRHLPPWAEDRRFIVSYLTYSGFLNRIRLKPVRAHYASLLGRCAPVAFPTERRK
jgi:uncharacterized protein (TIGR02421 family)